VFGLGNDTVSGGNDADIFDVSAGGGLGTDTITDFGNGADFVLTGANTVSSGLGSTVVVMADGSSLVAGNGHIWLAGDFHVS
jgi:Ca2+-binding RTX toxin-like protein